MNQPSNQQGGGAQNTFASQPGSQTNPFTADLKGEFTSNFGTNTNAVSQIFKEGGFAGSNRMKYYLIAIVVLLIGAGAFYYMTMDPEMAVVEPKAAVPEVAKTEETAAEEEDAEAVDTAATDKTAEQKAAESAPQGAVALASPANGAALGYDELQGSAKFSWEGEGGTIVFSRSSTMKPEVMRVKVTGNNFAMSNPWPGTWFWRVENASGASEVRTFKVSGPSRRNIALTAPAAGATVAGSGGEVSWQGDTGVAYYRVEMSGNGDWANPQFKFASSGSKLQLNGVTAGKYQMRLGAFSEVSGRWEYTQPVEVTVQ